MTSQKVGIPRMRTPTDVYTNELQAQHTLQSDDILKICHLANIENIFDQIESFSFEQFFGFACHLFITTESQQARKELASILPKFGSISVFSLLKISHHLSTPKSSLEREQQLGELAMNSLKAMPVPTLVIGLAEIIETEANSDLYLSGENTARIKGLSSAKTLHPKHRSDDSLIDMIVPALITLTAHQGENIISLLSHHLSSATWNNLQQQLLQELSTLKSQASLQNNAHRIKIKVKKPGLQLVEVA